jgi:hypothetical protein
MQKSTFCPSRAAKAGNCRPAINILTLGKCTIYSIIENIGSPGGLVIRHWAHIQSVLSLITSQVCVNFSALKIDLISTIKE